jgi:hypothetical protein
MTKKQQLATSLLDERVRVIVSIDPDKANEGQAKFANQLRAEGRPAIWAYWGDYARVRAVYMKDGELYLSLQRENCGELFECFATHVQVTPAPAN